jgi:anti-anti-sigma regulatory factor
MIIKTYIYIKIKVSANGRNYFSLVKGRTPMKIDEKEVRMINIKEMASAGTLCELCKSLEARTAEGGEIVLDFKGVKEVSSCEAETLMSTCLRLKESGVIIRLKGMSLTVRDQFLLSAINNARDEILL